MSSGPTSISFPPPPVILKRRGAGASTGVGGALEAGAGVLEGVALAGVALGLDGAGVELGVEDAGALELEPLDGAELGALGMDAGALMLRSGLRQSGGSSPGP